MSSYYFAYGSNMNPQRMRARQLQFQRVLPGRLAGVALAFNKRASDAPNMSYANIVHAPQGTVEGVLYELSSAREIAKMDPFEGTPRFYSREIYSVATAEGDIPAWVYVANRAMITDDLLPARWYVEHLLAGREFLSESYYRDLLQTPCREEVEAAW